MKTLSLILVCALPLAAQTGSTKADTAKAAAIIDRHMKAVGGEHAIRAIKESHVVTIMTMSNAPGVEMRQELWMKAPNLMRMKMTLPMVGATEMGFDGTIAWSYSEAAGANIHPEVPKQLTDNMNFGLPDPAIKSTYVGRRKIGDRTYDAVRALAHDTLRYTAYFDVETGLQAGMDTDDAPPPPPGRMALTFSDYKRFGAVLRPTTLTVLVNGQEMVTRTISISDGPFDKKVFEAPEAVRQLRDKPLL